MSMPKIQIGVIIYTKIGTNTSILMDEFRFFNNFKTANPDCDFIFIAVSEYTKKSILTNRDQLNFPLSIVTVKGREDLSKLDGLSGVFSYMTRNTFFGGGVDKACIANYMISAYCTNQLGIPLFVRTPDSEYPYLDYKRMAEVRVNGKAPSAKTFEENNRSSLSLIPDEINYSHVYFVANGSRKICDWVVDIAHNDLPEPMRMTTAEEISKRTLYVSDADLFNVWTHYKKYEYLPIESKIDKFVFIGYLQGSVAKNRLKALPKVFKENKHWLPTDIIGPGAADLLIDREDVTLHNKGIYGKDFFETMNQYLAYIFVGKGNSTNKYINKTVYDCVSSRCPVVVFSGCDTTGIIFDDKEFYFSNEDELKAIYEKLKNPEIRRDWVERQYNEIKTKLDTLMDPMFSFHDYCKRSQIRMLCEVALKPLF
jgi:hypothetical protein